VSDELLPPGAFLTWRYVDAHRGIDRRQVYYDDGRVEAVEGDDRWVLCRFTREQVASARAAVTGSGLTASGSDQGAATYDAAPVTYAWRLDGEEGQVTNTGYPATRHDAIDRLDAALAELEEAAGGWPLLAED
jgi:hypothetical protein